MGGSRLFFFKVFAAFSIEQKLVLDFAQFSCCFSSTRDARFPGVRSPRGVRWCCGQLVDPHRRYHQSVQAAIRERQRSNDWHPRGLLVGLHAMGNCHQPSQLSALGVSRHECVGPERHAGERSCLWWEACSEKVIGRAYPRVAHFKPQSQQRTPAAINRSSQEEITGETCFFICLFPTAMISLLSCWGLLFPCVADGV